MLRRDVACAGCLLQVPAADAGPRPLLLALHGDSHDAGEMLGAWQAVAEAHDLILFAPTCPKDRGCVGGSWWRWFQSAQHDAAWLGRMVETVRAEVAIDPLRIYATGYSGGASYLGFWAPAHAAELAAVGYVAGGYPYAEQCASCKLPVRVLIGAADGMYEPYVKPLITFYEGCGGHDVSTRVVPGLGHKGMLGALPRGEAELLWRWMEPHQASCVAPAPSAPLEAITDAAPAVSAPVSVRSAAARTEAAPPATRGCSCQLESRAAPVPWLAILLGVLVTCARARRPRRHPRRARTAAPRRST